MLGKGLHEMRRRSRCLVRCRDVVLALMFVIVCVSCRKEPEREQVVLYCSVDQAVAEPIVAAFEAQTGVKVLARYDTEASKTVGLVQRIRAEAEAPAADVFWSSEVFHTIRLAQEGLLARLASILFVISTWAEEALAGATTLVVTVRASPAKSVNGISMSAVCICGGKSTFKSPTE